MALGRRTDDRLIVGRLTEHGKAPYGFVAGQNPSYFVKLVTTNGVRVLWGKDLNRALSAGATRPKVGDVVGARRVSREPVTLSRVEHDDRGRVVRETEQAALRTRWEVEKVQHFAERTRVARQALARHLDARDAVRAHPELRSAFLSLRAAEVVAAKRIPNAEDRERFVALVREAMVKSVSRGTPIPDVRIREQTASRTTDPKSASTVKRDDPLR